MLSSAPRRSMRLSTAPTTGVDTETKPASKRKTKPTPKTKTKDADSIATTTTTSITKSNPRAPTQRRKANSPSTSAPSTPLPKRSKRAKVSSDPSIQAPPLTPTPATISLLSSATITAPTAPPSHPLETLTLSTPRPAAPNATNAPLSTPNASQILTTTTVSPNPTTFTPSPSKNRKPNPLLRPDVGSPALPTPTSTIDTLLTEACTHLCTVDPKLKGLVEKHHCKIFSPEGLREVVDPFTALASGIIGQQVSGQAAASIRRKFTSLFPMHPEFPTPAQVVEKDVPTLRTAGLSQRKAEYIHGLAEKFASGELSAEMLISARDEELIEKLVAVRGLGRWSVEMFACFGLKRMDVFSTGDLGVQRGMATYVGKDVSKLKNKGGKNKYMTEKEMLDIAARFSPYRSLFMWYMWRISDVDVSVLQD